jgi:hypothetical protein
VIIDIHDTGLKTPCKSPKREKIIFDYL